ncbi:MAG: hypothetical protein Q4D91_09500 [Lautropia sp.]|nr:hypothetical protein [Lautropia sp.]
MSTQKHHALNPQNAPVAAARPVEVKAAKLAAKKVDLDKLAKADIEEIVLADAPAEAPVEVAMAEGMASPEASNIGAMEGAAAAEGAAPVNPALIGAGAVAGVVAIAALAGGGGSSSGSSNDNLQQKPPVDDAKNTTDDVQAEGDKPAGGTDPAPGTGGNTTPGTGNQTPPAGEVKYGQAVAEGQPEAPKVSPDGETKLTKSKGAFLDKLKEAGVDVNDTTKQFIRIDRIEASENGVDHGARAVRYPEDNRQGVQLKAPGDPTTPTAYEVVTVKEGITLAEAKAAAEKLGGKLMVVDNASEAEWLKANFKNMLDSAEVGTGAWIGGSKLDGAAEFNAAVRNDGATDINYSKAAGEKLTAYVVEFENYKHPLMLDGKPVAEGQVINAADFDKLVWQGDSNKGGKISFSVVDNDQATAPGKVTGALSITESAAVERPILSGKPDVGTEPPVEGTGDNGQPGGTNANDGNGSTGGSSHTGGSGSQPGNNNPGNTNGSTPVEKPLPTYPANNASTVNVTENKADATLDKALFIGTEEAKAPEFIKILTVELPGKADDIGDKTALFITHSDKVEGIANDTPNFVLHQSLFDKISWNASLANGGSFTFVPVADENGTAIPGAKTQTVTINETPATPALPNEDQQPQKPAAPEYEQSELTVQVAHNGSHTFSADFFDGKANSVTHVKVSAAKDGTENTPAAAEGTLKFDGANVPAEGKVIAVADAGKLVWDASLAQGGSFMFTPVADATGAALEGATEQTVTISEAAAPTVPPAAEVPTYGTDPLESRVESHDKADHNFSGMKEAFEGTGQTKATHIKISEIKNGATGTPAAEEGTLKYEGKNVDDTTVIDLAKLDQLVWNAGMAEGGSFKFTAVQANGEAIANGPAAQTVTINEPAAAPAPAAPQVPAYDNTALESAVAEHNKADHDFSSMKAAFEGTGETKATHIKITEIKNGTAGTPDAAPETLKYEGNNVTADTVIDLTKLNALVWDASKAVGGSFKFTAVADDKGAAIEKGPAAQTVTIKEPLHTPVAETLEAVKDGSTTVGKELLDSSVEGSTNPQLVKITGITPTADESAAKHVISDVTKSAYQVVKVDAGITLEDAKKAAEAMGGKLLEINGDAELNWIKGNADLMSKLNQFAADSDAGDIKKGAWFLNPDDGKAAGTTDKEGIFSDGTAETNLQFADVDAASGKLNGYVVEFNNYETQKAGLLVGDAGSQTAVAAGKVLNTEEMGKLTWDSVFNNGGEVKFIEVTSETGETNAPGAVENKITITEAASVVNDLLKDHVII